MLKGKKEANQFLQRHYLESLLSSSPFLKALAGGMFAYLLFLLAARFAYWEQVTTSFLHLWQVNFSITIFLGLWLGYHALASLEPWLEDAQKRLGKSGSNILELFKDTKEIYSSRRAFLFALPFIIGGLGIAFLITGNLPNLLFPFPAYTPAFVYAVFIELCIFMLYLLGAIGFWLLYLFTKAAEELSQSNVINYDLVDEESLKPLSNTVLRLCFFLLVIIASAMPGMAFVVFSFKNVTPVLVLGAIFGMILPTLGLTLSFFAPIYYLHKMLVESKRSQTLHLKEQIRVCEGVLQKRINRINEMLEATSANSQADDENLLRLIQYLRGRLEESQRASDWPFNLASILKLAGASMLPVIAFFAELMIRRVFS